jgi:FkbM family methyltransferase
MIHTHTFKGATYRTKPGRLHPQYSIDCFDGDEAAVREKHWLPDLGDVVVDVGASYGAYTLTAQARGATVHAFEPEMSIFEDLGDNVDANDGRRPRLYPFGLSDKTETIDARAIMPHWPAHTITHPYFMVRLDDLAMRRVDWLKIDVEGMEVKVLRGGQETIKRCRPRVLCECHVFLDKDMVAKCKELLPGYSFESEPMAGDRVFLVGTP